MNVLITGAAGALGHNLVENLNLKKKTVVPFCTSMSSGLGKSDVNLKKNANISSKTKWLKGRNFYLIGKFDFSEQECAMRIL